ncbi:TniQ family protein [Streptomyces massasporeus]|uniref:TniQ family protein n=1 Tax=Streptomyces massasporeus TaxID=67324 RepID=UPI00381AE8FB
MAERRDERLGRRRLHLRLRFLAGESTGSYVTRLAARNHLPVEGMLRSMGTGPMLPVEPQYTEMYLSRYARERLANLAGHPLAEMQKRLVGLRDEFLMPSDAKDDWEWPWDARAGYIVQACSLCAAQRGTRSPAWLILPDPWHVCLRHRRWTDNSRSTQHPYIDLSSLPDVIRAQQRLNRLGKRLGPAARWVFADACSILVRSNYLEDPGRTEEWAPLATQLGEHRVRPLAQLSRLSLLTRDLAWLEVRRLSGELGRAGYREWLDRATRRHGFAFREPLKMWHSQHPPLGRGIPELFGDQPPPSSVVQRVTGHELPSCLAAAGDLSCLPWLRLPNTMERLFL